MYLSIERGRERRRKRGEGGRKNKCKNKKRKVRKKSSVKELNIQISWDGGALETESYGEAGRHSAGIFCQELSNNPLIAWVCVGVGS